MKGGLRECLKRATLANNLRLALEDLCFKEKNRALCFSSRDTIFQLESRQREEKERKREKTKSYVILYILLNGIEYILKKYMRLV